MASYISQLPSFFFLLSAIIHAALNITVITPPRVAVPLGGNATIPCTVNEELSAIYWSWGKTPSQQEIVVSRLIPEEPTGTGLESGDFNLTVNNSLVINHMRLEYGQSYICMALNIDFVDSYSVTEVIATVKPRVAPTIEFSCHIGPCGPELKEGDSVNLTCTSDEARPAVALTWTDSDGIPIQEIFNNTQDGSQLGTFVTSSTIEYNFKRATTVTCQAEGEALGKDSAEHRATVDLILETTEAPHLGTGSPSGTKPPNSRQDNYNHTGEGEDEGGGLDLVTILMVAVAVSVLVVIILIVAVVVLYKKNQEYSFFPKSGKSYHRAEPEDYIRGYNEMSNKL